MLLTSGTPLRRLYAMFFRTAYDAFGLKFAFSFALLLAENSLNLDAMFSKYLDDRIMVDILLVPDAVAFSSIFRESTGLFGLIPAL